MYIAKKYFESRFNKIFKKGEIVLDEIAKFYPNCVEFKEGELLVEDPSEVEIEKIDDKKKVQSDDKKKVQSDDKKKVQSDDKKKVQSDDKKKVQSEK